MQENLYREYRAQLDRLKQDIYNNQDISPWIYIKKGVYRYRLARHVRVYAFRQKIQVSNNEYIIFALVDVHTKANDDASFLKNLKRDISTFAERYKQTLENEIKLIEREIQSIISNQVSPSKVISKDIQDRYESFLFSLNSFFNEIIEEETICETEEWLENVLSAPLEHNWGTLFNLLHNLIVNGEAQRNSLISTPTENGGYRVIEDKVYVDFKHFIVRGNNRKFWLLERCGVQAKGTVEDRCEFLGNIWEEKYINEDKVDNLILRKSYREYPSYLLIYENIWSECEKGDVKANLALSTEEKKILENLKFPSFINGRAGSGKSTILYYIFAYLLYRNQIGEIEFPDPPVFITYSKKLLDTARDNVENIVKSLLKRDDRPIDNLNIDKYFRTFESLLSETAENLFKDKTLVVFGKFKKVCCDERYSFTRREPEIVWYCIKAFIGGYRSDTELTPEEYLKLSPRDRDIDSEVYQQIYEEDLQWYRRKKKEENLYDLLDVTKEILKRYEEGEITLPSYSMVFCDESQDFSNVEIELLLRLSPYVKFDFEYVHRVPLPYVFAGDPLQSINPSGFRWERFKANFYKVFRELGMSDVSIDFYTLTHNYRATHPLICVANTIQLLRKIKFDIDEIKPQIPWRQDDSSDRNSLLPNARTFKIGHNIQVEDLEEITKREGAIFIFPFDEGEEERYISKNEDVQKIRNAFLKKFSTAYEDSENKFSFLNVSDIKGMEYKSIIVYGFGDYIGKSIFDPTFERDSSRRYKLSHDLNKLYVAITRAEKHLFIVDTESGFENLWKYITEPQALLAKIPDREKETWKCYILSENDTPYIEEGIRDQLQDIYLSPQERRDRAKRYKAEAERTDNPKLYRYAAIDYHNLGTPEDIKKYNQCLAKAYELEERWERAGDIYKEELSEYRDAGRCYWEGCVWDKILNIPENILKAKHLNVAKFINEPNKNHTKNLLHYLTDEEGELVDLTRPQWIDVYETIKRVEVQIEDEKHLEWLGRILERYGEEGIEGAYERAAELYKRVKNWQKCVNALEKAQRTNHPDYYYAKAELHKDRLSERFKWLNKLGEYEKIKEEFDISKFDVGNWALFKEVIKAYDALRDIEEAFILSLKNKDFYRAEEYFMSLFEGNYFTEDSFLNAKEIIKRLAQKDDKIQRLIYGSLLKMARERNREKREVAIRLIERVDKWSGNIVGPTYESALETDSKEDAPLSYDEDKMSTFEKPKGLHSDLAEFFNFILFDFNLCKKLIDKYDRRLDFLLKFPNKQRKIIEKIMEGDRRYKEEIMRLNRISLEIIYPNSIRKSCESPPEYKKALEYMKDTIDLIVEEKVPKNIGAWRDAVALANKFGNKIGLNKEEHKEDRIKLYCHLLDRLARTKYSIDPKDENKEVSDHVVEWLLNRFIIGKIGDETKKHSMSRDEWEKYIDVYTLGAAWEKSGKLKETRDYYRALMEEDSQNKKILRFARERYVKCFLRFAEYTREKYEITKDEKDRERAEGQLRKAKSHAQEWGLVLDEIPEFPNLPEKKEKLNVRKFKNLQIGGDLDNFSISENTDGDGVILNCPPVEMEVLSSKQCFIWTKEHSRHPLEINIHEGSLHGKEGFFTQDGKGNTTYFNSSQYKVKGEITKEEKLKMTILNKYSLEITF